MHGWGISNNTYVPWLWPLSYISLAWESTPIILTVKMNELYFKSQECFKWHALVIPLNSGITVHVPIIVPINFQYNPTPTTSLISTDPSKIQYPCTTHISLVHITNSSNSRPCRQGWTFYVDIHRNIAKARWWRYESDFDFKLVSSKISFLLAR